MPIRATNSSLNHHLTIIAADLGYQLAEVYTDLGQYIASRPLFERAVTIWESLSHLKMIKPEETIFFMDALVALQMQNDSSHWTKESTESGEKSRSAA